MTSTSIRILEELFPENEYEHQDLTTFGSIGPEETSAYAYFSGFRVIVPKALTPPNICAIGSQDMETIDEVCLAQRLSPYNV